MEQKSAIVKRKRSKSEVRATIVPDVLEQV